MQTHLFELLTKTFAFAIDVKAATDQFVDQTKHFDRNLKMKFWNFLTDMHQLTSQIASQLTNHSNSLQGLNQLGNSTGQLNRNHVGGGHVVLHVSNLNEEVC